MRKLVRKDVKNAQVVIVLDFHSGAQILSDIKF